MLPLLIATLEGDLVEVQPVGGWFTNATKAVSRRVSSVGSSISRVGSALSKPIQDIAKGDFRAALINTGRAATTLVTAPVTTTIGVVDPSTGRAVEGVIKRNDPAAMVIRNVIDAGLDYLIPIIRSVARPIVRSFAGEDAELFGSEEIRAKLREQRTAIIAAVTAPAVAAATAAGGPPGGAAAAALVPPIVDELIDEIASQLLKQISPAASAAPVVTAQPSFSDSKIFGLPAPVVVGGGLGVLAAVLLSQRKSR